MLTLNSRPENVVNLKKRGSLPKKKNKLKTLTLPEKSSLSIPLTPAEPPGCYNKRPWNCSSLKELEGISSYLFVSRKGKREKGEG
jgi:hypothetical protein